MTGRSRTCSAISVGAALVVLVSGCRIGEEEELARPARTVTVSPSADVVVAPVTVPVGRGPVSPADVIWAQGGSLHVGTRTVDLAPVLIEALALVPGGVFVLSRGELWFTDLSRLRGTGLTDVTGLGLTADGSRVLVTSAGAAYAYDTASGRRVSSEGLQPRTEQQRLDGPSRAGVAVPRGFELAGWAGTGTFYGTTTEGGSPRAVVSCSLAERTCAPLATIEGTGPVVLDTGTQGTGTQDTGTQDVGK